MRAFLLSGFFFLNILLFAENTPSPLIETQSSHELSLGPEWNPILEDFQTTQSLESKFVEQRHRPFRRIPSVFKGTLRLDPEAGISFLYEEPSFSLINFHNNQLYRMTKDGSSERLDYPEAVETMNWLSQILSWDTQWLKENVTISGIYEDDFAQWTLNLVPKSDAPGSIKSISLSGNHKLLTSINISNGPNNRIVIVLSESRLNPTFSESELKSFFPASQK